MNEAAQPQKSDEQASWFIYLVYLLPFFVFMLVGSLEPTPKEPGGAAIGLAIPYAYYPWVYAAKISLTVAAILFVLPGYRDFPLKFGRLAIVVGIIGGPLWIGICQLDLEHSYLQPLLKQIGLGNIIGAGDRAAFNPFEQLADRPAAIWSFLAVRFLGLVIVVPILEEFFLRGFVMRFFMDRQWWEIPFGKTDRLAVILGTAVPMTMHPGELFAAFVWFSMITWLMLRTRNIWDCVVAHALTNLILGVYVVSTNTWRLM
jgi:CAAX prenyl protease-like protein